VIDFLFVYILAQYNYYLFIIIIIINNIIINIQLEKGKILGCVFLRRNIHFHFTFISLHGQCGDACYEETGEFSVSSFVMKLNSCFFWVKSKYHLILLEDTINLQKIG